MASSKEDRRKVGHGDSRLDRVVVERGLAPTRTQAQALVMAGQVRVNGSVMTKAGHLVKADDQLAVDGMAHPYVSRGGLKLEEALKVFDIQPDGWDVVDVGASTGGFTDCWLKHGARHVWAVDVGYGQLDWRLRTDPRVTVLERTNARWLTADMLPGVDRVDAASIDASFIGIALLLKPLLSIVKPSGRVVGLVKPQFEAGREHVGKNGVVRDRRVHEAVLSRFVEQAKEQGWTVLGLAPSPIRGPEGNIEFLSLLAGQAPGDAVYVPPISHIVDQAWEGDEQR
ncbi:MAG: TlyA family rRNA (cytidine-2'-O)-methyltransferase [Sulfobacillus thermosulfidooxidans]|nr:MAG: TlyA family rRNA (cytidine-2'-O)-methyltransferase [Sulfobacillus thermosulfidooxidans]